MSVPADETHVRLEVPPGYREAGRLDVYLTRFLQNATRAKVQRGIKEGRVRVNGQRVTKPSHLLGAGDVVECVLPKPPPMEALPEAIPLAILYEDDALIVLDKPPGLVVHPAYGNRTGTLVNALLHHVGHAGLRPEAGALGEEGLSTVNALPARPGDLSLRPGIVHRLDKDTSGLMVVAKDDWTHQHLARQFARRTIRRRYQALVWGVPDPPAGRVETALGRDPRDRKRMAVVPEAAGKHAVTHYDTLEAFRFCALLAFRLETGRTHQIRVHAQHLGHPIFGDPTSWTCSPA